MSASILKNLIIEKVNSVSGPMDDSVPPLVQSAISQAITEYINSTVKLIGSYSGVTPSGSPESVQLDSWNITGSMPTMPVPSGLESWLLNISNGIKSSFYTGLGISHPITPVPALPFVDIKFDINELTKIHEDNYDNPQDSVILRICEWITDAISIGYVKSVPAGLLGTGVFTISKVEV